MNNNTRLFRGSTVAAIKKLRPTYNTHRARGDELNIIIHLNRSVPDLKDYYARKFTTQPEHNWPIRCSTAPHTYMLVPQRDGRSLLTMKPNIQSSYKWQYGPLYESKTAILQPAQNYISA